MKKQTRERIALLFFAALVVFAVVVLIGYFTTGRSWTVAASVIDDAAGSMEDYTVIVYAGTVDPQAASASQGASDDEDGTDEQEGADPLTFDDDVSDEMLVLDDAVVDDSSFDMTPGFDAADANAVANAEDASTADASAAVSPADASAADAADASAADANTSGAARGELSVSGGSKISAPGVFMSDVRDQYEQKGAGVLSLDSTNMDSYFEPQVLYVGDKSIGVYSLDYYATRPQLAHLTDYFDEQEVDAVVCVTKRASLLATYEGTDVVIVTCDDEDLSTSGQTVDGTLIVRAPDRGDVGVIVFSTNNVPSAKVVDEL